MKYLKTVLPVAAVVTATTFGGAALVSADTPSTATSNTQTNQSAPANGKQDPSVADGGKITTDETVVASVTSAVQAKSSGATIDRVAKLPDGSYLAFTVQNGNKVIVSLDANYTITSTKDVPANAPSGQAPSGSNPTQNTN